jgi:DNA-binding response OmpR family regulator
LRILITEDDAPLAEALQFSLAQSGYAVDWVANGVAADEALKGDVFGLLILDLGLPKLDGFEVLRRLRRRNATLPVLILSGREKPEEKVLGLDLGADDYLVKPFSLRELISRVKALLRRAYGELADVQAAGTLRRGDLLIDLERRRVSRDGQRISLTATEFDILRHLAARPGRVFTRGQLLELVRDYDAAVEQDERTINVHVSHIRDKIEPDPAEPRYIRTVRGVGYAFAED